MKNFKNYSYRLNICPPNGEIGEGDFYFIEDADLLNMCPHNEFKCIPEHYSTVAYELIPEFLKKKTGDEWSIFKTNITETTTCLYANKNKGQVAWLELFKGEEVMYNWDEEDRLPQSSTFSLFMPNGKEVRTNSAELVAKTIVDSLICNVRYPNYAVIKR